jgi:hypothetical protein
MQTPPKQPDQPRRQDRLVRLLEKFPTCACDMSGDVWPSESELIAALQRGTTVFAEPTESGGAVRFYWVEPGGKLNYPTCSAVVVMRLMGREVLKPVTSAGGRTWIKFTDRAFKKFLPNAIALPRPESPATPVRPGADQTTGFPPSAGATCSTLSVAGSCPKDDLINHCQKSLRGFGVVLVISAILFGRAGAFDASVPFGVREFDAIQSAQQPWNMPSSEKSVVLNGGYPPSINALAACVTVRAVHGLCLDLTQILSVCSAGDSLQTGCAEPIPNENSRQGADNSGSQQLDCVVKFYHAVTPWVICFLIGIPFGFVIGSRRRFVV